MFIFSVNILIFCLFVIKKDYYKHDCFQLQKTIIIVFVRSVTYLAEFIGVACKFGIKSVYN